MCDQERLGLSRGIDLSLRTALNSSLKGLVVPMLGLWAQLCRTVKALNGWTERGRNALCAPWSCSSLSAAGRWCERESPEDPQRSLDLGGRRPQDRFSRRQLFASGID